MRLRLYMNGVLIGHGEIGHTSCGFYDQQVSGSVLVGPAALPALVDPPGTGRVPLTVKVSGLIRFRHTLPEDGQLPPAREWMLVGLEGQLYELSLPMARSDWYEQVVSRIELVQQLNVRLHLPNPERVPTWAAALEHLAEAEKALTVGDSAAVFGRCRAALDALPGAKTAIFDSMAVGPRREAIDELTKAIGKHHHTGRHVAPSGEQVGTFPVTREDAAFVYDLTRLLLSHIACVTL
jgi:hypothetical protein